jgi:lipopolysaccharide transport system ATP-binding protein
MSALPKGTVLFDNVSKRYRLGALGTMRDRLDSWRGRNQDEDASRILWALRDVSFQVQPGESLGLIGPNGAGKTTTLKLLSNITQPTTGTVNIQGRRSSLIELGAGFHPELSGRENIYLNGAILGLKRAEIARKFDAIVDFSELERFLDTPVKRYSSGMYVRLGFAVAAHVEPEVLLVDEVLAVGDTAFRQKCMTRMEALRETGTTLVFVSHNMYQVQRLCAEALLLNHGQVAFLGTAGEAVAVYEEAIQASAAHSANNNGTEEVEGGIVITEVALLDSAHNLATSLKHNQDLVVRTSYKAAATVHNPIIKLRLVKSDGTVAALVASHHDGQFEWPTAGVGTIQSRFEPIQLASGSYIVEARIADSTDSALLASGQSAPFMVIGSSMAHEPDPGVFVPNVVWSCEGQLDE